MKKKTSSWLVGCLFCVVALWCTGKLSAQNVTYVNLNFQEASFVEVINEFRKQTGVKFMYNLEKVKDKKCKNLVVEKMPVSEAIPFVLKHFGLTYSMVEGVVVVKEESQESQKSRIVKGNVVDESGDPLPGVTVTIKGSTVGVATDVNGNFTISIPEHIKPVLNFSFIGMQRKELECTSEEPVKVVMKWDETQLDEVTIIEDGYNRLPRKDMVGAFTTVRAEDVMMPAYNSIDQMLQGKIPGMVVVNRSTRVGAKPSITIRGRSTLLGNTDPLWVVDGIIQSDPLSIDASATVTEDLSNLIGNQIFWLNPADIETITVLKDASATAIYGSKASNGVIVITTKKGQVDRMNVRYSANFSFRTRPNYDMFNFMNSKERIQFSKEAYDAGVRYNQTPIAQLWTYEGLMRMFNGREIDEAQFMKQMEFLETCNTDWFDLLTRNSFSHSHNLSISGGSKKVTYSASLGYQSSRGQEIGDDLTQFTTRLNVSAQFTERLKVTFGMNGSISDREGFGPGVSPLNYATRTSRALPAYDQNGERVFYKQRYTYKQHSATELLCGYNIFNEMDNSYAENRGTRFNFSLNLDYKLTDWLTYGLVGDVSSSNNRSEAFAGERTGFITKNYRGYDYGTEESGSERFEAAMLPYGGQLANNETNSISYNLQNKLMFSKTFADEHRLNAMVAMEIRSTDNKNSTNTVWGYIPERGEIIVKPSLPSEIKPIGGAVFDQEFGVLTELYNGGWKRTTRTDNYLSFFATLAYSLKDRYVFNFNVRSDASNRFGQDANKQFDPTYSVGFSWRMAEEEFVKNNLYWLNQFNLRGTFGIQGNAVTSISPELIVRYNNIPVYDQFIVNISSIPNPLLSWERTKTWNFGLDLQVFNGIVMHWEYYGRRSNAIIQQDIAEEYGLPTMYLNAGRISNHGIEFSTNITPFQTKDFAWTVGINASKNWNKSQNDDRTAKADGVSRTDFLSGNSSRPLKKGYALGSFWSYSFAGLDPETGYPTFNHLDFETADPSVDPTTFLVYSGQSDPYFTGGFNTRIRYKNLSLAADFSLLLGSKKRLPNPYSDFANEKLPAPENNINKDLLKRWKQPGDEKHTIIPALYTSIIAGENQYDLPDGKFDSKYSMWAQSDAMVVNASFLRCTQISLSWNMSKELCGKIGVSSFSFNANVNNPFVIASKRFNGFDPEVDNSRMPKIFSAGINVGF